MASCLFRYYLVSEVRHAIAATVLRNIQSLIGDADEIFFRERIGRITRYPHRGGDVPNAWKRFGPDPFTNTFSHLNGTGKRCLGKNHGELLATVASREINLAATASNCRGNRTNDKVSTRVTEAVVHLF